MQITVFTVLMFCGVVVAGFFLWKLRTLRQRRLLQERGLRWLKLLRIILANAQRHRGLTSAYAGGDRSVIERVEHLHDTIEKNCNAIVSVGAWIEKNDRWQGIVSHWRTLSQRYADYSLNDTLNQHLWMIQNILYLIEDMADSHALAELQPRAPYPVGRVDFAWKDLLQAIEYIGQLRAVGSGVAAMGSCGSVERVRINYLIKKIDALSSRIFARLGGGHSARTDLFALISMVNQRILGAQCTISAAQYFEEVTQVMEALYAEFDSIVESLDKSQSG